MHYERRAGGPRVAIGGQLDTVASSRPNTMLRAAIAYAVRFGWHVFPIKPGTKEPHGRFVRRGFLDASCDPEQISMWWTAAPDAWIAVAARTSGLVIIDSDDYKPECDLGRLQTELGSLPETPRALTQRGGTHYYFKDCGAQYSLTACPGVDVKSDGYCLLPPSPGYSWDLAVHPLETPVAELPDRWLAHLTKPKKYVGNHDNERRLPSSDTDAAFSWFGAAFAEMGWLGIPLDGGKRAVRCPWLHEHSDGRGDGQDSSAVLFPRTEGKTLGAFFCSHSHCAGRNWQDVAATLSPRAVRVADEAMRKERNRFTLEMLEQLRRVVGR